LHRLRFCRQAHLLYQIFYYNHDESVDLRIDTILQPLFFVTDRLAKYLGKLFICLFITIISVAVYIFYTSIFVHLFTEIETETHRGQHSYMTLVGHLLLSHWLLINIMFNYIQCTRSRTISIRRTETDAKRTRRTSTRTITSPTKSPSSI
jgi:hypothetical protein